jgi:hypothetical protein
MHGQLCLIAFLETYERLIQAIGAENLHATVTFLDT